MGSVWKLCRIGRFSNAWNFCPSKRSIGRESCVVSRKLLISNKSNGLCNPIGTTFGPSPACFFRHANSACDELSTSSVSHLVDMGWHKLAQQTAPVGPHIQQLGKSSMSNCHLRTNLGKQTVSCAKRVISIWS